MATPSAEETKKYTKEEYLDMIKKSHDNFRQTNPEQAAALPDFRPSAYTPGLDFIVECREYLGPKDNERFDAAIQSYMGKGTERADEAAYDKARAECMTLLEGTADLQKKWDGIYGKEMGLKVQDAMRQAREAGITLDKKIGV